MKKSSIVKKTAKLTLLGLGAAYVARDIYKNLPTKAYPDLPKENVGHALLHELLLYLENPALCEEAGVVIDNDYIIAALIPAKKYIDGRYDCQDFRMHSLLRLQYKHIDFIKKISPDGAKMIEDIFLNAKYWMTEPGEDSMCYWSENHQILYAVAEYLAGQMWHDRIFANDGASGSEHMKRGRERIKHWMKQRFLFGFSEYNSTNYYLFNVGPAANFIEFADEADADMVTRMKICLDLLLFDVASNMFKFSYIAPTGRAYVDNMVGVTGDRVGKLVDFLWGNNDLYKKETGQMLINFYSMYFAVDGKGKPKNLYRLPQALFEIGKDEGTRVIKSSHSMDTSELEKKGYVGHADHQIMRQLCMESFTNPEVIYNTLTYLEKNNMFSNKFVNFFKILNTKAMKSPARLRAISEKLNPMPNGIAIQRANLYTYRTKNYQLMNVQRYHPGCFGAQQMLNMLNFGGKSVVFTAHPAKHETEKSAKDYPGYWAGFGRSPHAVQHENVLMLIYKIPKIRGVAELYAVPQFTHTYLPEAYFDEVILNGKHVFARRGDAYLALSGANELKYKPFSMDSAKAFKNGLEDFSDKRFDLIQEGNNQFWIYELSDTSKESFGQFILRVKANAIHFDGLNTLRYETLGKVYSTAFGGEFKVGDEKIDLEHKRFDSDYGISERESDEIRFEFGGHKLRLNYDKCIREESE